MKHTNPTTQRCAALLAFAIAASACGDDDSFTLGTESAVSAWPAVLAFSDVPRGEQAVRNVTLEHIGSGGTVRIESVELITESPDLKIGVLEAREISAGEQVRIQVLYNSDNDAPDEGTLLIGLNIRDQPTISIPVTTPGQRAVLVAIPATLDFGVVQAGAPRDVPVTIQNVGTADAVLMGLSKSGDDDDDFSVTFAEDTVIAPGSAAQVQFSYSPTGVNKDEAILTVLTDRADVTLDVPVEGQEESPILVAEPATVQFGWVEPGGSNLASIKLRNEGNTSVLVWNLKLQDAAEGVGITNPPSLPLELKPGEVFTMGGIFSPLEELPMDGTPIATLQVRSTDAAHDPLDIPFYGAAGAPDILVVPSDVIDFAYVAEGFKGMRTVTILNVGDEEITIESAVLEAQTSDEFSVDVSGLPTTLDPTESTVIQVYFENKAGEEGTEYARLLLNTTDKLVPAYPLDVVARRSERPTCEPAFVPDLLSMGAHKPGNQGIDELSLVNFGSGNCEYRAWDLLGCTSVVWGIRTQFDCDPLFPYTPFEVLQAPAYGQVVGPGEAVTFKMGFNAPPVLNTLVGRDDYYARIAVTLNDPNLNAFKYVAPPGGWAAGINLRAQSALPIVDVDPSTINFSTVRTGCASDQRAIQISNLGPMDAVVTEVDTQGCGAEVLINNLPPLPYTLSGFQTLYLEAVYAPVDADSDACTVTIKTDAVNLPVANVAISGSAIDVEHNVDTFFQEPTPRVDVLFVVDDSGSMSDDQVLLQQNLPVLVDLATTWGQDYHLAVTTTDPILVAGRFQGVPSYVNPDYDPNVFADNLLVGTTGHWEEMGLNGAWLALSGPNNALTDISCANVPNACPEGLWCLDGVCKGPNHGFMRENADLIIILISDEEDSSPETVDWYIQNFASLKDPQTGYGVKVHAFVHDDQCFGAGWGSTGDRYMEVVKQFDGHVASLCAVDFTTEYTAVAQETFGLKDQFYPSLPPDPATLEVRVDDVPCTSGWAWNADTKAVVFDKDGACYPPYNSKIEIEYDVFCNQPSN